LHFNIIIYLNTKKVDSCQSSACGYRYEERSEP
jgi:hypothetical protein